MTKRHTPAAALALYARACETHKRADWRMACHAMAAVLQGAETRPSVDVRPAPKPARERSLLEYLSARGIHDRAGELKARGLDKWHREGPFRRRLVNVEGWTLEEAAQAAWEAGYFPDAIMPTGDDGDAYEAVTPGQLLDAMSDEYSGRRVRFPNVGTVHDAANEEFDAAAYDWAMQGAA